jgi:hypothetical protein
MFRILNLCGLLVLTCHLINEVAELTQKSFINGTKWEVGRSLYEYYKNGLVLIQLMDTECGIKMF